MFQPFLNWLAGLSFAADLLLRSTLLLTLAWTAQRILSFASPTWRIRLWRTTGASLLILLLVSGSPRLDLKIAQPPNSLAATNNFATQLTADTSSKNTDTVTSTSPSPNGRKNKFASDDSDRDMSVNSSVPSGGARIETTNSTRMALSHIALSVWALGVLLFATKLVREFCSLQAVISSSVAASNKTCEMANEMARHTGIRIPIHVRVTDKISSPCVVSATRGLILLPQEMSNEPFEDLRCIVAHELGHIRHHDVFWSRLLNVIAILGWIHPLCWRIPKAHMQACDERCDVAALEFAGSSSVYSKLLARLVLTIRNQSKHNTSERLALSMARPSTVLQRIEFLQSETWKRPTVFLGSSVLTLVLMFAAVCCMFNIVQAEVAAQEPAVVDAAAGEADDNDEDHISEVSVLLAKHVLLYKKDDGRLRIGTWDDAFNLLEKVEGRAHFTVRTTYGTNVDRLRSRQVSEAQDRFFGVQKKFERRKFTGMTMGGVGRVVSFRYDQVKSAKDLRLDPKLKVTGQVVDQQGMPVAGAEVVIVFGPKQEHPTPHGRRKRPFDFYIKEGKLRNRSNDIVSICDHQGRFSHYRPQTGNYSFLAIHPNGFRHITHADFNKNDQIQLKPWAKVNVQVPGESAKYPIGSDITSTLSTPKDWPEIKLYYYDEFPTSATLYEFDHVAPGEVVVSKSVSLESGGLSFHKDTFQIGSDETKTIDLNELSKNELASIEESIRHDRLIVLTLRGQPAPEFELTDKNNKTLKLSEMRGQIVFLNVWSSQRKHSMAEFARLKKLHKQYHDKGLTIVSLSMDKDKQEWETFLTKNDFPWHHVWLDKGLRKKMEPYTFLGTGKSYLIDATGKIFERNLEGEQIDQAIGRLSNQKFLKKELERVK